MATGPATRRSGALSDLELSESDSDSSVACILGVCLHGFNGDAWMSDAEGAQDDMQVGAAAGDLVTFRGARRHGALGPRLWRQPRWQQARGELKAGSQ